MPQPRKAQSSDSASESSASERDLHTSSTNSTEHSELFPSPPSSTEKSDAELVAIFSRVVNASDIGKMSFVSKQWQRVMKEVKNRQEGTYLQKPHDDRVPFLFFMTRRWRRWNFPQIQPMAK